MDIILLDEPRTRSRDRAAQYLTASKTNSVGNGSPSSYIWQSTAYSEVMHDVISHKYARRIEAGEIINNPLYHDIQDYQEEPGFYQTSLKTDPNVWTAYSSYNGVSATKNRPLISYKDLYISAEKKEELLSRAKQSALAAVDKTPYALGEDFFEMKQTINTLADPLSVCRDSHDKLASGLRDLSQAKKRGYSRGINKALNALTKSWLGTRYAYGSVVYSALTVSDILREKRLLANTNRGDNMRRKAKSGSFPYNQSLNQHSLWGTDGGAIVTLNHAGRDVAEAHAGIIYRVKAPSASTAFDLGLRLKDVPRATWQVLPLTWLTDRFFDISKNIQGAMNYLDPRVEILAGYTVWYHEATEDISVVRALHPLYNMIMTGKSVYSMKNITRTPWTPTFSDTRPSLNWEGMADPAGFLDLASVTLQRVSRLLGHKY